MNTHPKDSLVQLHACGSLQNLAFNNQQNQQAIAGVNGIERLLETMRQFPSDVDIQQRGCGALWNLAFNDSNRARISSSGGIEVNTYI